MDTLAGATTTLPQLDPTGRSFALLDRAERERLGTFLRPLAWLDGLIADVVVAPEGPDDLDSSVDWLAASGTRRTNPGSAS